MADRRTTPWTTVVVAALMLLIAVTAMVIGLLAYWSPTLILVLAASGVPATWLAITMALSARRTGTRAAAATGFVLGAVGLTVLVVGLWPSLPRPDLSWLERNERPRRRSELHASLSVEPRDGALDVAPDQELVVTAHGARFRPDRWVVRAIPDGHGSAVNYDCTAAHGERRLRCSPRVPLSFATTYELTVEAGVRDDEALGEAKASVSFATAPRSARVVGVAPDRIQLVGHGERGVEVVGRPGALPESAERSGWRVIVVVDGEAGVPVPVDRDGGFAATVASLRHPQRDARRFHLAIVGGDSRPVVRLPLEPLASADGRTVRVLRGRPFVHTTPGGVRIAFSGRAPADRVSWVTVGPAEPDPRRPDLPPQLGWAGTWKVDTTVEVTKRASAPKRRDARDLVNGPPLVDLGFPAADEVPDGALVFDGQFGNVAVGSGTKRLLVLRGIGRVVSGDGVRRLSFAEAYPVAGGGEGMPAAVVPAAIYDQPMNGVHHLLYERSGDLALVVGDYLGGVHPGEWIVNEHTYLVSPGSPLPLAAPQPIYGVDVVTKQNRTLVLLPVLAGARFRLEGRHQPTGWLGTGLDFSPVARRSGVAVYIGDLDRLSSAAFEGDRR